MTVTVKICGLRDAATLGAALDAGVDMVGFVHFERSPRHLSLSAGRELARQVARRAQSVALTADADDATLEALVEAWRPDLLQLHGHETPERVGAVRALFGLPVIKAIPVASRPDLEAVAAYDVVCDHLLFDAQAPDGAGRPGGNGGTFDWSLLRGLVVRRPWLLAGGLRADTVADALRISGGSGVDVSSGVEVAPGVKDASRIIGFVAAARAAVGETAPA